MTNQPDWKCVAQLGDVNPIDHGGYWVFVDRTGVYPPEAEHLESPDDDNGTWIAHSFILDRCTFKDGILSDNQSHPEHPAWFAHDLQGNANSLGVTLQEMIRKLCSDSPVDRAMVYREIGLYHGFENLDSYPLTWKGPTARAEVTSRYEDAKHLIVS